MKELKKLMPEIEDKYLRRFKKFLDENGAYEAYISNFEGVIDVICISNAIAHGFTWCITDQGSEYWDKLYLEWRCISSIWCNDYTVFYRRGDTNFNPIQFRENRILGNLAWSIKEFYNGVKFAFDNLHRGFSVDLYRYNMSNEDGKILWGCRSFTHKEIKQLKKALEEEYGERLK